MWLARLLCRCPCILFSSESECIWFGGSSCIIIRALASPKASVSARLEEFKHGFKRSMHSSLLQGEQ
ncbi:hypothetical protein ZWY2020_036781 [Hordeum vulgare]|nr:hypothetical protein ZWY2020_036781 [Hordeum vulgare]